MDQAEANAKAKEAVLKYDKVAAEAVSKAAIESKLDLPQVISEGYTKGIQEVGDLFEQKKLFLPHIMAAAAAMTAGVDILTPEIEKTGASAGEKKDKIIICSIEGDIHSIGKDIVAIMLKVAGFDVANIGRDVAIDTIVDECKKLQPKVVGTSALMTSTMVGQKTFEEKLKAAGIRDKLLTNVGGAPVSQQWADDIGADIYSENATDCVNKVVAALEN